MRKSWEASRGGDHSTVREAVRDRHDQPKPARRTQIALRAGDDGNRKGACELCCSAQARQACQAGAGEPSSEPPRRHWIASCCHFHWGHFNTVQPPLRPWRARACDLQTECTSRDTWGTPRLFSFGTMQQRGVHLNATTARSRQTTCIHVPSD